METTKKKRTREEVRAAFRETMRKKKERMEDNLKRMEELELQGFFCITKKLFVRWFNLYEHRGKYIIRTAEGKMDGQMNFLAIKSCEECRSFAR